MKKQILIIIASLLFYGCGFTPIYKEINFSNLSIQSIEFSGNRNINSVINEKLFRYTNSKKKSYNLKVNSAYTKKILAKDTSGNVTNYELILLIKVEILKETDTGIVKIKELQYTEKSNTKNESNNLTQKNLEKNIIDNLAKNISREIVFDLSNLNDN